ncbi:ubiquitin carboxyl-terminal hydrolase 23-like [Coffea eugenioides]|uniref:ubiquitin carboxyl-terminal hydrolase 23-like n=1 Tax=Coffea eugenioides TaxID=49369 RepID=UPI000F60B77D|nr:ubiquitin carboxyl-terminal hydrolase 23-like [Coffea eugenioides]
MMAAETMMNSLWVGSVKDPEKEPVTTSDASNSNAALFHRRIEFHLAKKPFNGFNDGGNSGNGFKLVTLNPYNSNASLKSEPHKAWSGSGKPPSESSSENHSGLDPELSFTITFRRIGAGLQNLGNTCFLNSVLQCLTYTEPLAAYLQSDRHKISCRTAGFCALCAIQKHVSQALESTGRILAPKDLVSNLRCISRNFRNARQEDAHEYMVNLLESMHKCCLPSGVPSESPSAYDKSLVHKIFGGRLRSQVKCMQCSFCSNKFDPFLDLSLEIVKADSLYKALAHFTAKEQLDGGERQYQCQQCKQKVKALKQLTVYKAPHVLAIHLKRFGSHMPGQKIDKKIEFGPSLDLKPFVTGPYDGELKYTLYGVLVHAGWSTHSGHYYCFVRTSSGMWYSLDDNQVVQVSERRVLEQKAYMLFYVRDRMYSTPKKVVDAIHKESMVINTFGRKTYPNLNQGLKENIMNGAVGGKLNDSFSATAAQKDVMNSNIISQNQMKKDPAQKINGPTAPEEACLKKDQPAENSLKVPPVDRLPTSNINGGDCLVQSLPSSSGSDGFVNFGNSSNSGSSGGIELTTAIVKQKDINSLQISAGKNKTDCVVIPTDGNTKASTGKYLSDAVDRPANGNVLHRSPQDTCVPLEANAGKVGCFPDSIGVAEGGAQKVRDIKDRACQKPATKHLLRKRALSDRLHLVKRKPLKRPVTTKHLSRNIILGAALGRRKKKKRARHCSPKKLDGNHVLSDLGPSTSEESKTSTISCSAFPPRGFKSNADEKDKILGLKGITDNADLLRGVNVKVVPCRDEVGQHEKVPLSDTQSRNRYSTAGGELFDNGKSCGSMLKKGEKVENGLMRISADGLEETTVARWDGVECSPEIVESRSVENLRIGYIGDEWDEEYDQGRRKKIRGSKLTFDGTNPFQEIATHKAKTKKAKLDRSSSANQPFRI